MISKSYAAGVLTCKVAEMSGQFIPAGGLKLPEVREVSCIFLTGLI